MARNHRNGSNESHDPEKPDRRQLFRRDHAHSERDDTDPGVARSFASGAGGPDQSAYYEGPDRRSQDRRRDYGRGPQQSGGHDPHGRREPRFGSGYGGYGEAPGEGAAGFGSGRTYAAEPGWGPGYGDQPEQDERFRRLGSPHDNSGRDAAFRRGSFEHVEPARRPRREHADWRERPSPRWAGRGPKGYQRSDERLREDICERLMWDDEVDASEVSVDVKNGVVTLEGAVPERRMKHLIEDVADACLGVKDIENRIRVTYGEHHDVHADDKPPGHDSRLSVGTPSGSGVSGISGSSSSGGSSTGGEGS